jgi:phosphoserine phosphatase
MNGWLPPDLLTALERLSQSAPKIAAFDMDDTLLVGDIGDAVFAQLIGEGKLAAQDWDRYQALLASDYLEGCKYPVRAMAGLTIEQVIQTTRKVLESDNPFVLIPGTQTQVPLPRPNRTMLSLLQRLQAQGYDVYVITATNVWSARWVAAEVFGIAEKNVLGIEAKLVRNGENDELTAGLQEPVTVGEGKVLALKDRIGDQRPLLAAGNSASDYALLRSVRDGGLVIWAGKQQAEVRDLAGRTKQLIVLDSS